MELTERVKSWRIDQIYNLLNWFYALLIGIENINANIDYLLSLIWFHAQICSDQSWSQIRFLDTNLNELAEYLPSFIS